MSLIKSSIRTFLSKLIVLSIGMISSVLIVKIVGVEGKGYLSIFYAFFGILISIFILSIGNGIIFYLNKNLEKKTVISTSLFLGSLFSLLTIIVIALFSNKIVSYLGEKSNIILVFGILYTFLNIYERIFDSIFVGLKYSKFYNNLQTAKQIIYFVLITIVYFYFENINYKWILTIAIITLIIKIIIKIKKIINLNLIGFIFSKSYSKQILDYSLKAHFGVIIQKINTKFDILIVGYVLTVEEIGIYSIALLFSEFIWIIPDSIGLFMFPYLSDGESNSNKLYKTMKINRILLPIVSLLVVVIPTICFYLIPFLYGNEFTDSIKPLYVLCIANLLFSVSKIVTKYFSGIGEPMINSKGSFIGFLINCFLTFYLTSYFGLIGAAFSCLISYFFILCFYCFMFFKINKEVRIKDLFLLNSDDIKFIFSLVKK